MKTISQLIHGQEKKIWAVKPDDLVDHAVKLMAEKDIGALLVISQKKLIGVVSERDCTRKTLLSGLSALDTTVETIMTPKVALATFNNKAIADGLHHFMQIGPYPNQKLLHFKPKWQFLACIH